MNRTLIFVLILLCIILVMRLLSVEQNEYPDGEVITVTARLTTMPEQKGRVQAFSLRPDGYEPVYLSVPLFPEYTYGQILTVTGKVKLSGDEQKTFATMAYPAVQVRENDSLLYGLIGFIREKVMGMYQETLPPTGASLLMGIVFGIKQGMPADFKDALSLTGVYHVVAASGMNVTLVAGAFIVIFGRIMRRQFALFLSIFGVFFYAFLAGFEPSIVRASIMGSIVFVSGILGRQHMALWTLGVTGYLMLFFNPLMLTDIGFQLSFLATLSILVLKPVMYRSQTSDSRLNDNLIVEDFRTTLAAQLGTLPVLLSAFGQVSFLSIIVNMLILWTIPILMFAGASSALLGFFYEPLGTFVAFFALPFLMYFEWIVLFFTRFDLAFVIETVSWQMAVGYYLMLFSGAEWLKKRYQNTQNTRKDQIVKLSEKSEAQKV